MIKRNDYLEKIRPFINRDIVKVLTGIRRSGKSVLLQLIQEELLASGVPGDNIIAVNFESEKIPEIKTMEGTLSYLNNRLNRSGKTYFFFDEVQELTGWEKVVNSIMIDHDADIYITGSNARLLSGELATYLAGRYVEIKVYPFSFKEVLAIREQKNADCDKRNTFNEYLNIGGMPFLHNFPADERTAHQYLTDIYHSIVLKDIASRNKVRDIEMLKRSYLFLMSNIGNPFSAAAVMKYLKSEHRQISSETLYNYVDYAQTACFIHLAPREDLIGKKALSFREKIYLTDHGFREAIFGNNQRDIQQVLENIVYLELLRRGFTVLVGKNEEREVDFVALKSNRKMYVQVAYLLAGESTIEREFGALETIPDNYPKYVVSLDEVDRSRNGIIHMNIRDFLLQSDL